MKIDELFDLPAHPLIVHAAVVLIPLAAFGALLCLLPSVRHHLLVAVFAIALGGTVAVFLAEESGQALRERVDDTDLVAAHSNIGGTLLPWAIALTIALGALVALEVVQRRRAATAGDDAGATTSPGWYRPAAIVVSVAMAVSALACVERVVRIGHSGAKAAWTDVDLNGGPAPIVEDDDGGDGGSDSSGPGGGD
jgi:hypothetical protein